MSRTEAHELLDAAKAGVEVAAVRITQALMRTGDITPLAQAEIRVAARRPVWAFVEGIEA